MIPSLRAIESKKLPTMYFSDYFQKNQHKFGLLVFDVDGVLVDTSNSFPAAISEAIKQYGEIIGFNDWPEPSFEMIGKFKQGSGFNNDWDLEEALVIYYLQGEILDNPLSFPDYLETIESYGGGLTGVSQWMAKLRDAERRGIEDALQRDLIRHLAMEHYAGGEYCEYLYGISPRFGIKMGTLKNEKTLVNLELLVRIPMAKGIYSGRNSKEFELVSERFGKQFWHPGCLFCDDGTSPIKPDPGPLYEMIETTGTDGLIFVGDSRDDQNTVERFRRDYSNIPAEFVLVLNSKKPFDHRFSHVDDVNDLLMYLESLVKNKVISQPL